MRNRDCNSICNIFVAFLAILNAYYMVAPHFNGGVLDIDHKMLIVVILVFFALILITVQRINQSVAMALCIIPIAWLFVTMSTGYIGSFVYYTKWILFSGSIILYSIFLGMDFVIEERTLNIVFWSHVVPVLIYVIESFDPQYYVHTNKGPALILTFDNQNSASMQLLFISAVLFLSAKRYTDSEKKYRTFIAFVGIVALSYLIWKTGSRSSTLGVLLLLICYVLPSVQKLITKRTIVVFMLFPLFFAVLMVYLYRHNNTNFILLGRNMFNGREKMWAAVFEQPISRWIIGSYPVFTNGEGLIPFQLHNGIVDMIASYGCLITFAFLTALKRVLDRFNTFDSWMGKMLVVTVLALLVESTGEAAFMTGGRCTFICMLFVFCHLPEQYYHTMDEGSVVWADMT